MPERISAEGYSYRYDPRHKRCIPEHRIVWENYHGPIPPGYVIHHRDGDRLNNALANLDMLEVGEHSRLHSRLFYLHNRAWIDRNWGRVPQLELIPS